MALRLFEKTLADVAPDLRRLYVPDSEYGFRLDCDLDEHVHGLKNALPHQRDDNKALRAKYSVTDDGTEALSVFGGIPKAGTKPPPDVRGGLLPRRATAQRGTTE
jgi:hypothetical protein